LRNRQTERLGGLADVAEFHDRVIFAGLKLYTVNYGEITPMQIGMLGTMAQMFLSDLRDKTRRGQLGRARHSRRAARSPYSTTFIPPSSCGSSSMRSIGEDAPLAKNLFAAEASRLKHQHGASPCDRQVRQTARILTVDPVRNRAT
jgi:hypothetical protein